MGKDQQKLELNFVNNITATFIFAENKTSSEDSYSLMSVELNIPNKLLVNSTCKWTDSLNNISDKQDNLVQRVKSV